MLRYSMMSLAWMLCSVCGSQLQPCMPMAMSGHVNSSTIPTWLKALAFPMVKELIVCDPDSSDWLGSNDPHLYVMSVMLSWSSWHFWQRKRRIWLLDWHAATIGHEMHADLEEWIKRWLSHSVEDQGSTARQLVEDSTYSIDRLREQWSLQKESQLSICAREFCWVLS